MPATAPRLRPRALLAAAVAGLMLAAVAPASPVPAAGSDPWTPEEMQFVYELNRARWDPTLAGLAPGTVLPRPPLAVSGTLADAARFRSNEMAEHDYFDHQSPVTGDWPNEVARDHGYPLPFYWPDEANNIESIHYGHPTPSGALQSLIDSPSHRTHLIGQGWFGGHRAIGVGAHLEDRIWTVMTATDDTGTVFLTGVAFDDADGDGVMDPGEGLPGVTVTAGYQSTITNAGGGWAIPAPPGTYRVTAAGGSFQGQAEARVKVGGFNVGVDFVSGRADADVFAYELCAGREPTILGTAGDDHIIGTDLRDIIHALDGDDVVEAGKGRDVVCGGAGHDRLMGQGGNDRLIGEAGNDKLIGGLGNDILKGGPGRDNLRGGRGDDTLIGGPGRNTLRGGPGHDELVGGDQQDRCFAGEILWSCEKVG